MLAVGLPRKICAGQGRLLMSTCNPLQWDATFPPVYVHTSVSYLTHCPGFERAKQGDRLAAEWVATRCANIGVIQEIGRTYPRAVLLPVMTGNRIPAALAEGFGLPVSTEVYAPCSANRKSFTAIDRLRSKPIFWGKIVKGEGYIILDDIITQGGTVSALRKHVIENGGRVLAVSTLAASPGSRVLAPSPMELDSLHKRFWPRSITNTLERYGIVGDLRELTRAQVRYLLRFKSLDCLIHRMETSRTEKYPRLTSISHTLTANKNSFGCPLVG